MSSASGTRNFVEINDHAVIAIRTSPANGSTRIDTWREIGLQNRMEAAEAMRAVFPEASADSPVSVHCAVRPALRCFKISSADEAKQHATANAARAFVAAGLPAGFEPAEIACMYATDGRLLGAGSHQRWIAGATPRESLDAASAMLVEWNLKADRIEPAAFGFMGAARAALSHRRSDEPLVIWDAGAVTSDLFLVSSAGVEATRRVEFGFEQVFEALMSEIQLKFKGAAVRLFFNDRYDFSDAGPKIATRVSAALQEALAALALQAGGRVPATFCAASLPSKQAWFSNHLSSALNLAPWAPDMAAWIANAGVSFADAAVAESLQPNALGALNLVSASQQNPEADAWHAAWTGGATEAVAKAAAPAPSKPVSAPAKSAPVAAPVAKVATPVAKPIPTPSPIPARAEPVKVAAKAAGAATAEARPAQKRPAQSPAFPAPSTKTKGDDGTPIQGTATPAKAEPPPSVPKPTAGSAAAAPQKSGNKKLLWIGVIAFLVLVAGGFFAFNMISAQKANAVREKQEAEQRATELAEANRQAEQKAQAEAEARRRAEQQVAEQQQAAEAARKRGEVEAQQRETERVRLLNARGSLVVKTEPPDATVTVGNLAPRPTPAVFHDLRLGLYPVEISKPGYDTMKFEVEIKENVVLDRGEIPLVRETGSLSIATTPAGTSYSVSRSGEVSFSLERANQFKGVAPAELKELPTGTYTVTLERAGWNPVTKEITIARGATATVNQAFNGGVVKITSVPEGAEVFGNNISLGRTPVTLSNISPGSVTYRFELADHHPATATGTVEADKTVDIWAALIPMEKLARIADLEAQPKATKMVQPKLPKNADKFRGQKVLISIVVDEHGMPRDWRIVEAPDDALAETCIEAIAQWRFDPARANGQPVRVRVTVPLVLN